MGVQHSLCGLASLFCTVIQHLAVILERPRGVGIVLGGFAEMDANINKKRKVREMYQASDMGGEYFSSSTTTFICCCPVRAK